MTTYTTGEARKSQLTTLVQEAIAEVEDVYYNSNYDRLKEHFIDQFISDESIEEIEMYDLVFAKKQPAGFFCESKEVMNSSNVERKMPDDFEQVISEEELKHMDTLLPPHMSYVALKYNCIHFKSSIFKRIKAYLVPNPKYVAATYEAPATLFAPLIKDHNAFVFTSAEELKGEGRAMKHCVGREDMGYIRKLETGASKFFSIRTPENRPLFTVEFTGGGIQQIKGTKNRLPGFGHGAGEATKLEEVDVVLDFISKLGVSAEKVSDIQGGLRAKKEAENKVANKVANKKP